MTVLTLYCLILAAGARSAFAAEVPIAYAWPVQGKASIHGPPYLVMNNLRTKIPFLSGDLIDASSWPVVHIETENVSGRFLIEEFLRQDPRYTAVVDGDFVVIMSTWAAADKDYPLSQVIDRIVLREALVVEVVDAVCVKLSSMTGRDTWFSGGRRDGDRVTIELSSRTARNILMEAATQNNDSLAFHPVRQDVDFEPKRGVKVHGDFFEYMENGFGNPHPLTTMLHFNHPLPPGIRAILERREDEMLTWNLPPPMRNAILEGKKRRKREGPR